MREQTVEQGRDSCCVVIPAFREGGRIGRVVCDVLAVVPHVVVVDDGSPDATAAEAEAAGAVVIRHGTNRGKGAAVVSGLTYAREHGFSSAITMDGDGQHSAGDIPAFLDARARSGCGALVGNRMADTAAMPLVRRLTNRFMSWLLSREMGQRVPDTQCGFRLYDTDLLPLMLTQSCRFDSESEVLLRFAHRGVTIGSVPIRTLYGDERSKIRPVRDAIRFFRMLSRLRRERKKPAI